MHIAAGRKRRWILNDVCPRPGRDVFASATRASATPAHYCESSCSAMRVNRKTSRVIARCPHRPSRFSQLTAVSASLSQNSRTASRIQFHQPILSSRWSVFPGAVCRMSQRPVHRRPVLVTPAHPAPACQTTPPCAADLPFPVAPPRGKNVQAGGDQSLFDFYQFFAQPQDVGVALRRIQFGSHLQRGARFRCLDDLDIREVF